MRELTGHKTRFTNSLLTVEAMDFPGENGASSVYRLGTLSGQQAFLDFANGITEEALIEICIDRLRGIQGGEFASTANQQALKSLCRARDILLRQTRDRMALAKEGVRVE